MHGSVASWRGADRHRGRVFRDAKDMEPSGPCAVAEAYSALFPAYQLLIQIYVKAQEVVTRHEQLDSALA